MKFYQSTRGGARATAPEAILRGIAPDGGLFTPEEFPKIDMESLKSAGAGTIWSEVLFALLDGFSRAEIEETVSLGYAGKFETDDIAPLVPVGNAHVLELFRGPTSAFKDVALSILPRLITLSREKLGVRDEIAVLTATSGDTGKAALEGFRDVAGTRIVVFYPEDGVSGVQKAQMVTQPGGNVRVCAVRGNFDDAQTGVKRVFQDDRENGWAGEMGVRLSSANSINLGRLAPQVAYYFKAYLDLVRAGTISLGDGVNFAVPTGNFGNILAGDFARRMGLPVAKLVCASNENDVLTDFIKTGVYDRRRAFYKTASPSMDILVSSNLERYLYLESGRDARLTAKLMRDLSEEGVYEAPESVRAALQEGFRAGSAADREAFGAIRAVWERHGYLLDTHTAVAWAVCERFAREADNACPTVVLATASPYKFASSVLEALGAPAEGGFAAVDALFDLTGVPVPKSLSEVRGLPVKHTDAVDKENILDYVKGAIA
ncbi:MAG: threonine synthase [Clostridiales bacterium]|nr:threonine synthase [Clostridiales bacterium]